MKRWQLDSRLNLLLFYFQAKNRIKGKCKSLEKCIKKRVEPYENLNLILARMLENALHNKCVVYMSCNTL